MAVFEASSTGQLSGSANYSAYVYIRQNGQDPANNRTNFYWEVRLLMSGGSAYNNDQDQSWSVNVGGNVGSGTFRLTQADRYNTNRLLGANTVWVGHNPDGTRPGFPTNAWISTAHSSVGSGGSGDAWIDADRIPKPPSKPPTPTFRSATPTTIDYNFFNSPDNGGSAETTFNHQSATDANFTQNLQNWNDAGSPGQAASLIPGTGTYIRYRSVNAVGVSPWSDALFQTTLPAVPPGLMVEATPAGTQALLTFSPPGGVTGVVKYDFEYRVLGSTTVVAGSSPTTTATVTALVPGTTYEWRASAWIAQYQSPWSTWQSLRQPNPNISPGEYWDGATVPPVGSDLVYAWTGAAGLSTSTATGRVPVGWTTFAGGAPAGATGAVHQTVGGADLPEGQIAGAYAVRVVFHSDTTAAGFNTGTQASDPGWSDVTPAATYVGSIYVNPSRSQRMAAMLVWSTAAGAAAGSAVGPATEVVAGVWTRLAVTADSPATAEFASIRVTDVAGSGFSVWHGGDVLLVDAAMISLAQQFPYFDGSLADTSQFVYAWTGAENASTSTRTPFEQVSTTTTGSAPAPGTTDLTDPDCAVVPAPPRPPVVPDLCIDNTGIWRRYYANIVASDVSDWLSVVPTLEVVTGAQAARQVRIRVYANPFNYPPSQIETTEWCSEQILSYMPASTVLTLDGVTQRAWAEVNGGSAQSADHLLYGSNGTPPTWPVLSCGISYLASFDVPIDANPGNTVIRAYLTRRV